MRTRGSGICAPLPINSFQQRTSLSAHAQRRTRLASVDIPQSVRCVARSKLAQLTLAEIGKIYYFAMNSLWVRVETTVSCLWRSPVTLAESTKTISATGSLRRDAFYLLLERTQHKTLGTLPCSSSFFVWFSLFCNLRLNLPRRAAIAVVSRPNLAQLLGLERFDCLKFVPRLPGASRFECLPSKLAFKRVFRVNF